MLGTIKLKCTNVGCTDVIGYDDFQKHLRKCIKSEINCASCDIGVPRTDMDDHKVLLSFHSAKYFTLTISEIVRKIFS